jgi:hypothetical protein
VPVVAMALDRLLHVTGSIVPPLHAGRATETSERRTCGQLHARTSCRRRGCMLLWPHNTAIERNTATANFGDHDQSNFLRSIEPMKVHVSLVGP